MRHFNLETFAGGELSRQINRDIEAVMRNVVDPNTDVKAKRKITVTIEFKPNEQRNFITTNVNSKPTLAPALGAVTALGVQQDLTSGAIDVAEIGSKMPEATVKVDGKTVDTETGEIMEKGSKVVDLRKREA
ncbi:putative uncharacterized protein [Dorea formicigenerans CAG:28]|jgi:hypothetical protein|uniref:hypothetical protein n=1 Tax=Veillonella sp. CAG:933 TaxID=1262980 RepID=UPI00033CF4E4|nr:hypothetical protein [Veillonella sp. CAG:933]CCX57101.1 putative uncharacterized protein [Veillonella sp. CAG:933]CDC56414.1 putative uncharacterized protein [Dorea formicigenerans CAG:28]